MSTMIYTNEHVRRKVVQRSSLGKGRGVHLTWVMFPDDLLKYVLGQQIAARGLIDVSQQPLFIDDSDKRISLQELLTMVQFSGGKSFDERTE